jgi:hypothetical protein
MDERDRKLFGFGLLYHINYISSYLISLKDGSHRERLMRAVEVTPISLKLLGTSRILGKGCSWDLLYELSGVSAEVHSKWTLAFLAKFSTEMYSVHVYGPRC